MLRPPSFIEGNYPHSIDQGRTSVRTQRRRSFIEGVKQSQSTHPTLRPYIHRNIHSFSSYFLLDQSLGRSFIQSILSSSYLCIQIQSMELCIAIYLIIYTSKTTTPYLIQSLLKKLPPSCKQPVPLICLHFLCGVHLSSCYKMQMENTAVRWARSQRIQSGLIQMTGI